MMRRRRRPFRRPFRGRALRRAAVNRRIQGNALSEKVHRELRRANQLTENGEHLNAAAIFSRLAESAHDRGILRHAPMLYLQAAKAYTLGGDIENGFAYAKKGLGILAETERWQRLSVAGTRAVEVARDSGFNAQAEDLQSWLDETLAGRTIKAPTPPPTKARRLPPKCPFCGATVRSDEVEWIDAHTAECAYCGSAVPTEE
jgi:hypothetical protein